MKTVFFAGSFNPFTRGHADIAERLMRISDRVLIGIGLNIDKPGALETAEENASKIREWIKARGYNERMETVVYSGLTGEVALSHGADCLARGIRNGADFDYEYSLAAINRDAFGIDTLLLTADPSLGYVSSSAIRDLESRGRYDLAARYLPDI